MAKNEKPTRCKELFCFPKSNLSNVLQVSGSHWPAGIAKRKKIVSIDAPYVCADCVRDQFAYMPYGGDHVYPDGNYILHNFGRQDPNRHQCDVEVIFSSEVKVKAELRGAARSHAEVPGPLAELRRTASEAELDHQSARVA